MGIVYTDEELERVREVSYEYFIDRCLFVDRCLFCERFTEETLLNDVSRHSYCNELKLKVIESGICKQFLGL